MRLELISAINKNLQKIVLLLENIEDSVYVNEDAGPYYSSIGNHLRHVLDYYSCIINGLNADVIDLTLRDRNSIINTDKQKAIEKTKEIQNTIFGYEHANTNYLVKVVDDLGEGKISVDYTLESILVQANTHTVHHFASIAYILHGLKVSCVVEGFGYNPTTPILVTKRK